MRTSASAMSTALCAGSPLHGNGFAPLWLYFTNDEGIDVALRQELFFRSYFFLKSPGTVFLSSGKEEMGIWREDMIVIEPPNIIFPYVF